MTAAYTASVIVPYHNEGELLNRALDSICAQQVTGRVEIIVVDDCSERSPDLRDDYRWPVKLVRTSRPLHATGARNVGIRCASGEFICFLDADDAYLPDRIESHVEFLHSRPELSMVGSRYFTHRKSVWLQTPPLVEKWFPEFADKRCVLPDTARHHICTKYYANTGAVTVRRERLIQVGGFDDTDRSAGEWDLQVRLAQTGPIGYLPEPAYRYLCRPGSICSTINPQKQESSARMFKRWRHTVAGLPLQHLLTLRHYEQERLLLAAQIHLEEFGESRTALACAIAALLRRPSVWGLRSTVRTTLHTCFPRLTRRYAVAARSAN